MTEHKRKLKRSMVNVSKRILRMDYGPNANMANVCSDAVTLAKLVSKFTDEEDLLTSESTQLDT